MDRHWNLKRRWRGKGNLKNNLQRKRSLNPRKDNPRAALKMGPETNWEGTQICKIPERKRNQN